MKKQLKVLALTTSVLFGLTSSNWAAAALDETGTNVAGGTKAITGKYASIVSSNGSLVASSMTFGDGGNSFPFALPVLSTDTQTTVAARLQASLRALTTSVDANGGAGALTASDLSITIGGAVYQNTTAIGDITTGGPHTIVFSDVLGTNAFDVVVPDAVYTVTTLATAITGILAAITVTPASGADTDLGTASDLSFTVGAGNTYGNTSTVADWSTAVVSTVSAVTMSQAGTEVDVSSSSGAGLTLTSVAFSKDSHLHLFGPNAITVSSVTAPSSGDAFIHLKLAAATFSANPAAAFDIIADYKVGAGATLTGAAGALAAGLTLNGPLTLATVTSLTGAISGDKNLTLPASVTAMSGDMESYRGNIIPGGNMSMSKLPPLGGIELGAHTVTVSEAGTLGKLYPTGAGTFDADANVVINELDLRTAGVTLAPAAGVTIVIKKFTGGSDQALTINGAGTVKILSGAGDTSGGIVRTAGTLDDRR